jgi:hypothetical protein
MFGVFMILNIHAIIMFDLARNIFCTTFPNILKHTHTHLNKFLKHSESMAFDRTRNIIIFIEASTELEIAITPFARDFATMDASSMKSKYGEEMMRVEVDKILSPVMSDLIASLQTEMAMVIAARKTKDSASKKGSPKS